MHSWHSFSFKAKRATKLLPRYMLGRQANQQKSAWPIFFCYAGLELFFIEAGGVPQWGAPSAFFAFPNAVEAGKAAQAMLAQATLGAALQGGKTAAAAAGSILEVLPLLFCGILCIASQLAVQEHLLISLLKKWQCVAIVMVSGCSATPWYVLSLQPGVGG